MPGPHERALRRRSPSRSSCTPLAVAPTAGVQSDERERPARPPADAERDHREIAREGKHTRSRLDAAKALQGIAERQAAGKIYTPPERIVVTLDQDGKVVESRSGELPEGASSSSRSETTSISETRCRLHRNRATETPHPPGRTSERGASSM